MLLVQCSKQTISLKESDPELQFEEAKKIFDKKNYYKAKMQFTVIVLNNPGHRIIEKAQFYLAESHYHLKEYIQAIAEYEKLIRSMPQSPFVDNARYKVGLCYYELSPGYALDQEYTHKAITQFQLFLEEYPASEVRPEVEKKLKEARAKLAKKEYKTGELYWKMGYYSSAVISFEAVMNEYYDTEYADDANYWQGACYLKLHEWDKAVTAYQMLLAKYPDSSLAGDAKGKLKEAVEKRNQMKTDQDKQD
jgi:outer membrane protein assembly factor BamD